jgi:hypothetical protein
MPKVHYCTLQFTRQGCLLFFKLGMEITLRELDFETQVSSNKEVLALLFLEMGRLFLRSCASVLRSWCVRSTS